MPPAPPRSTGRRRWPHRLVAAALILAGVAVSGWPVADTFNNNRQGAQLVSEYAIAIKDSSPRVLSAELAAARAYDAQLPAGSLDDPWEGRTGGASPAHDRYSKTLAASRAMARLRIPQINVDLPVYHDADSASMASGIGHMFGSSLPVGGPGTHAVLAGHTGYRNRTLLDRLPEVRIGQTFEIDVAGETLMYKVDQRVVVERSQLEAVQRIPGGDYVTLVTCYTPPGEDHTLRMLVRGVRVPNPATAQRSVTILASGYDSSVQTWMWPRIGVMALGLGVLAVLVLLWTFGELRARRRRARVDDDLPSPAMHTRSPSPTRTTP